MKIVLLLLAALLLCASAKPRYFIGTWEGAKPVRIPEALLIDDCRCGYTYQVLVNGRIVNLTYRNANGGSLPGPLRVESVKP